MIITVFTGISKKRNSTYRPSGGTAVTCVLKTPTSTMRPTFEISRSNYSNAASINYVVWGSNYYFVSNTTYETNEIITVECRLDVLATYKGEIQNSEQYVERAYSMYSTLIPDELNAPTCNFTYKTTTFSLAGLSFSSTGCYILTVAGNGASGAVGSGFAKSYALSASQVSSLANELYSEDIIEILKKEFTNPMSAIIRCIWLPIQSGTISGNEESIKLGSWSSPVTGKLVTSRVLQGSFTFNNDDLFPVTPTGESITGNTYLQCSPYSSGQMFLPFVGVVDYNVDYFYKTNNTVDCFVDVLTGDVVYSINNRAITFTGNCASDCPVAVEQTNLHSYLTAAIVATGGVAFAVATGGIGAITGGLAMSTIGSMLNSSKSLGTNTQINGAISSGISVFPIGEGNVPRIRIMVKLPIHGVTSIRDVSGLPLMLTTKLTSLSGYVKCRGANIATIADYDEKVEIEAYLNNGFYIE